MTPPILKVWRLGLIALARFSLVTIGKRGNKVAHSTRLRDTIDT